MKKNCRLIFIVLLLVFFSNSLYAQRGGLYIGKIDVRTVFLLHPSMIGYSPDKEAFRVTRDAVAQRRAQEEASSNEEEVRRLKSLMKSIDVKITEENNKYEKKMSQLYDIYMAHISELATGEAGMNRVTYKMESSKAEVVHNSVLTALYAQYSEAEDNLLKLTEFDYSEGYTTPKETEKRFEAILNEIKVYTQRIADQKGISIVLNTSYKRFMTEDMRKSSNSFVHDDMAFGKIFTTSFPQDLLRDEAAIVGYYNRIGSLTRNWLRNSDSITTRIKNSMLENDVFIGGVDLTGDVLTSLYKAYKLDPNISNAVIKAAVSY